MGCPKGMRMQDFLGEEKYLLWKEKNDVIRPKGIPTLTLEQELKRREGISKALTGKKHKESSSLLGKTFIEIHGEEKAQARKQRAREVRIGISSGMKGKKAWNKGTTFSPRLKLIYSKARIKSILEGRFNPQKNRFKAISKKIQTTKGGEVLCQGSWELAYVNYLEANEEVVSFTKDKVRLPYMYEGKSRVYIADFLVIYTSNKRDLVEIKPKDLLNKVENPAKFEVARNWCLKNNINFMIVTEEELKKLEIK